MTGADPMRDTGQGRRHFVKGKSTMYYKRAMEVAGILERRDMNDRDNALTNKQEVYEALSVLYERCRAKDDEFHIEERRRRLSQIEEDRYFMRKMAIKLYEDVENIHTKSGQSSFEAIAEMSLDFLMKLRKREAEMVVLTREEI